MLAIPSISRCSGFILIFRVYYSTVPLRLHLHLLLPPTIPAHVPCCCPLHWLPSPNPARVPYCCPLHLLLPPTLPMSPAAAPCTRCCPQPCPCPLLLPLAGLLPPQGVGAHPLRLKPARWPIRRLWLCHGRPGFPWRHEGGWMEASEWVFKVGACSAIASR